MRMDILSTLLKNIRFFGRIIFLYLLIFTHTEKGVSQTYYFDNYSLQDGLGQSRVYAIVQDTSGYIWLGTLDGVSRFDGNTFVNYTSNDGLAPGGVKSILLDSHGDIWMGHLNGGLTRYSDHKFSSPDTSVFKNDKDITTILEDADGNIWLGTYGNGAYALKYPGKDWSNLKINNYKGGRLSDIIFGGTLAFNKNLFLITDVGIKRFRKDLNTFVNFLPEGHSTYFFKTCMYEDSKGNIWYGTRNGGLIKYIRNIKEYKIYDTRDGLETNFIYSIFEDSHGNIWTSNIDDRNEKGGITRINSNGFKAFNEENGLVDNKIHCITEDREGNILIGTRDNGLCVFKGETFVTFLKNQQNGLLDNAVSAVFQDTEGKFWFGTKEGITIYSPDGQRSKKFSHFTKYNSLIKHPVEFIKKDRENNIWVLTEGGGIYTYNALKKDFSYEADLNNYIFFEKRDRIIRDMQIDSNNTIWLGTDEGLVKYRIENHKTERKTQLDGLSGNNISALYLDKQNNLWVGTISQGITRIDLRNEKATIINCLKKISPTCFIEDDAGNIWIGTEGTGIYVYDRDTITRHYTTENGLLSNLIKLLITDKNNNIYIGTNKGLNKYNPKEEKMYSYTRRDGFTGIETNYHAGIMDRSGNMWFGTVEGVTKYNTTLAGRKIPEPLVTINKLQVGDINQKLIPDLRLDYNQNSLAFSYKSVSLFNPDAVRYRVMLEGNDKDWQKPTKETIVKYDRLPPGKYTFKVKAMNAGQVWSEHPALYSFHIDRPFYQKWFFILGVAVLLISTIMFFIKIREQQLIREKEVLEEKVTERTVALSRANEELAIRNKDITDSIRYAKRIQFAILPPDIPFQDTYVYFRPKDIVSGDFYWSISHAGREFIAAVDCTGHGVPGAFMSFIGYNSLNKIVKDDNILQPAAILNHLNEEVATALHQKGKEIVNDGMDISIISYDPEKKELSYAGAFNPLYIFHDKELYEIKADRFSIGRATGREKEFTNHKLNIQPGDIIYIFTDGFADQFGGPEGKKYKTHRFKDFFTAIHAEPMEKQRELLEKEFEDWKGKNEQIDDILVIGRKF